MRSIMFMVGRSDIVLTLSLPKLIFIFSLIAMKSSASYFAYINKLILKFIQKYKRLILEQNSRTKMEKLQHTVYQATIITAVLYWQNNMSWIDRAEQRMHCQPILQQRNRREFGCNKQHWNNCVSIYLKKREKEREIRKRKRKKLIQIQFLYHLKKIILIFPFTILQAGCFLPLPILHLLVYPQLCPAFCSKIVFQVQP